MEKIQIQFRESDYKIYHELCQRYYLAHDTIRRQSIHAFLDLYQKGVIPLDAEDIHQARQFLTSRCDALKREQNHVPGEGGSTILFQVRICSDFVVLCDDVEKLFRLLQKKGVTANYIMILATFSNVIEENRISQIAGRYKLDPGLIEPLVNVIVETIRTRLGTDRSWRSAIRELTVLAARFNKRFPEPLFDQDVVMLIAPHVVDFFEKGIETGLIFSLILEYSDESELEEFESFLNKTPVILREEDDAGINWEAIYPPLEAVSDTMAAQRDQEAKERALLCDHYALADPSSVTSTPIVRPSSGQKTFDIAVGGDGGSTLDAAYTILPAGPSLGGMKPIMPVIIGISVILIFIIAGIALSGAWTPQDNSTSTGVPAGNITPAINPAATAKPTTAVTTVKTTATRAAYSSTEIGNHLLEIAFGPDNPYVERSTKNIVTISCLGCKKQDITLLEEFITRFNSYSTTTQISTMVDTNSPSDITLSFMPEYSLGQINRDYVLYTAKDRSTGKIYFLRVWEPTYQNDDDILKIYFNSDLYGAHRDRWIQRAALYQLGFYGESAKYSDSLFYSDPAKPNYQLTAIDLEAVQLMYGKKVTNGMTRAQLEALF